MLEQLTTKRRRGAAIAALIGLLAWLTCLVAFVLDVAGQAGRWELVFVAAWLLMMPAIGFLFFGVALPIGLVRVPLDTVDAVTHEIETSAARLGPITCAGRIGWSHYAGPLIQLRIYSQGVVICPRFSPKIPVRFSELSQPTATSGWVFSRLLLHHSSVMVRHPIEFIFYTTKDRDKVYEAIACEVAS